MSVGECGAARIVLEDYETVIYEYFADSLNYPEYRNKDFIYDGLITVSKSALVEVEIHRKVKRMPSGRKKLVEKRVSAEVNWNELCQNGLIQVKNSRYCHRISDNGFGIIAFRLVVKIFDIYQETGALPQAVNFIS